MIYTTMRQATALCYRTIFLPKKGMRHHVGTSLCALSPEPLAPTAADEPAADRNEALSIPYFCELVIIKSNTRLADISCLGFYAIQKFIG